MNSKFGTYFSTNTNAIITDSPSITNIIVEEIGTTFVTISWNSTSVGVTYTITYSTGDVMMSSITNDTNYTINGLTSGTSYRISVVPSDGVCQGEEKEVMVDTNDASISICATTGKEMVCNYESKIQLCNLKCVTV